MEENAGDPLLLSTFGKLAWSFDCQTRLEGTN